MRRAEASREKSTRLVRILLLLLRGPVRRVALLAELQDLYGASPSMALRRDLRDLRTMLDGTARIVYRERHSLIALEGLGRLVAEPEEVGESGDDLETCIVDLTDVASIERLIARLRQGSSDRSLSALRVHIAMATDYSGHQGTIDILDRALRDRQSVLFQYRSMAQEAWVAHQVEPASLTLRDGHIYFEGLHEQFARWLTYRVDRIQPGSAAILPRYHDELRQPGGIRVRYRLLPPLSDEPVSQRLREQVIVERLPDASVVVEGLVPSLFEARRMLLGYGQLAEALEPAGLRTAMADEVRTAAALYGGYERTE